MTTRRIILRNVCSAWFGFAVTIASTLVLTPLVLASLGKTQYGIWALVHMLTGYYGLLDLGISAGITQYMARYYATRDYENMNAMASTGFVCLAIVSCLLVVATVAAASLCEFVFQIPEELGANARYCVLIIGLSVAVQFLFFVYSAVFSATQRYDISSAIAIVVQLVLAAGTYFVIRSGGSLLALATVHASVSTIGYVTRWRIARRVLPKLDIRWRYAQLSRAGEFMTFGIWNVAINAGHQLIACADGIVIALLMSIELVTPYTLASRLVAYFGRVFVPIANVFFPAFTQLDAQNKLADCRALFLKSSRLFFLLSVTFAIAAFAWSADFIELWVGSDYVNHNPPVPWLLGILLIAEAVRAPQRVGRQVMLGRRRLRPIALLLTAEAILSLTIGVSLIPWLGLTGVALGVTVASLVCEGIGHPLVICRDLGVRISTYVVELLFRPLIAGLLLAALMYVFKSHAVVSTWRELAIAGVSSGLMLAIVAYFIGLNAEERREMYAIVTKRLAGVSQGLDRRFTARLADRWTRP